MSAARQRIAIVEDDPTLRGTLVGLLGGCADVDVVLTTGSEAEADQWPGANCDGWDIAIVDVLIEAGNGIRLLGLHRHRPEGRRIARAAGRRRRVRQDDRHGGADPVLQRG